MARTRTFTPDEVQTLIDEYFKKCENHTTETATAGKVLKLHKPRIPTIGEMALHIGVHLDTLHQWEHENREFSDIIKNAKNYCTQKKIAALINNEGGSTGIIFDLKVNHGWVDKQKIEIDGLNIIAPGDNA